MPSGAMLKRLEWHASRSHDPFAHKLGQRNSHIPMKRLAKLILLLEPVLLALVVIPFWFEYPTRVNFLPMPPTQGQLLIFLPLLLPVLARLILYRRLWIANPLNVFFFLFLALC